MDQRMEVLIELLDKGKVLLECCPDTATAVVLDGVAAALAADLGLCELCTHILTDETVRLAGLSTAPIRAHWSTFVDAALYAGLLCIEAGMAGWELVCRMMCTLQCSDVHLNGKRLSSPE